ncbi:hypothetical protein BDQ17DRAFT_1302410 [Cyathus striatus]|nr:hypothetical protein BDQ17DRAFT_1302410 [Cyathus striatus]
MNAYYDLTRTQIIASIVSVIVYGINITLFATSFYLLHKKGQNRRCRITFTTFKHLFRQNVFLICYISFMLILSTLMMASLLRAVNEKLYAILFLCDDPDTRKLLEVCITLGKLGDVAYTLATWGADVLLVWRCLVIYKGSGVSLWITAPMPILAIFASIVMGIYFIFRAMTESPTFFRSSQIVFAAISLALNVFMSILIVGRLVHHRIRAQQALGKHSARQYTCIISMIVESELLVVIFGTAFVVSFFLDKSQYEKYSTAILQVLSQIQVFAPLLITLRVALGKAWPDKHEDDISTVDIAKRLDAMLGVSRTQETDRISISFEPKRSEGQLEVDSV